MTFGLERKGGDFDVAGGPGVWAGLEALEPRLLLAGDITVTVAPLETDDTRPELTGTVDDGGADLVVRVDGNNYDILSGDLVDLGGGTWEWTLPDDTIPLPDALADGVYDVQVLATNAVDGAFGVDDTTDELTIDLDEPTVTVNELVTNYIRPAITGAVDDPDATISVRVNGVDYVGLNTGVGVWLIARDVIEILPEETYDVEVTATAVGGATGTDDTVDELTIDTSDPVVTVVAQTANEPSPEITGTIDDNNATIQVTVNGSTRAATNNEDGTWTLDAGTLPDLPDGTYDVEVTATDEAGNEGTDDTVAELVIELPPVVTVDRLSTSDTRPELTGTVSDADALISVNVNGIDYIDPFQVFVKNNHDGTWTLIDNTIAVLPDGTYDVTVTATVGGLDGTDDTVNELKIDTTDPTVTVDALDTDDPTPELTGMVNEPDADVSVNVNGTDYDAVNNGDGTWTLPDGTIIVPLDVGAYDVVATATDPAGNSGTDGTVDELGILP